MRLLLIGILGLGVSCDTCMRVDCLPRYDSFQFTYVDSNGNNLMSGVSPKYTIDDMEVYSNDSNNNEVLAYLQPAISGTTAVNVQLNYTTTRSFLKVKGEVKDTLDFSFKITKTKCCGEITEIEKTALNGVIFAGSFPIEIVERN